ncbi:mannose-6-phosphate isomerase, class I [Acidothermaceae bacterium B102]|nr:mannose-6-phosphate isomerase, class I [Acidothermaceae bacterium B102]
MDPMDLLTNAIQPYAWGSHSAIAALQGRVPADQPEAELWMGAHPLAPSRVHRGGWATLVDTIAADPQAELGPAVVATFGPRLPFLLKVLAAAKPLSLQVHPTPEQARTGFDAEDARGIPRDAPNRNYRDPYSKPELIVALTPFTGLCGFRAAAELAALLDELAIPSLKEFGDALTNTPDESAVRALLAGLLRWPQADRAALVAEVARRCALLRTSESPFAASFDWAARVADDYPDDTGVAVVLMLNLVQLAPGEAVFLKPRTLHAYLQGTGVEIMAGSDNVLRGGLTPKHIDVDELLGLLDFGNGPLPATPTTDLSTDERAWLTPTPEFRLSEIVLSVDHPVTLAGGVPQILLCTQGAAHLDDGTSALDLAGGQSVFVPASSSVVRASSPSGATVFRAVPGL